MQTAGGVLHSSSQDRLRDRPVPSRDEGRGKWDRGRSGSVREPPCLGRAGPGRARTEVEGVLGAEEVDGDDGEDGRGEEEDHQRGRHRLQCCGRCPARSDGQTTFPSRCARCIATERGFERGGCDWVGKRAVPGAGGCTAADGLEHHPAGSEALELSADVEDADDAHHLEVLGVEVGEEEAAELEEDGAEEKPVGQSADEGGAQEAPPVAEQIDEQL